MFALSVALANSAMAQDDEVRRVFSGGLIGGVNFTQVDGDSFYGYHKVGLNTGAVVYVHFTPKFGASMELIYTQKGSHAAETEESPVWGEYAFQYFMKLNYVEVPVTFHYRINKYDVEAGAAYARLVSSHEEVIADQPVLIDPVVNAFNTTDIDYVFGLSRWLYKGWYANFRFQYSIATIRPVNAIPVGYSWGTEGQFNNMVCLRLIYFFQPKD